MSNLEKYNPKNIDIYSKNSKITQIIKNLEPELRDIDNKSKELSLGFKFILLPPSVILLNSIVQDEFNTAFVLALLSTLISLLSLAVIEIQNLLVNQKNHQKCLDYISNTPTVKNEVENTVISTLANDKNWELLSTINIKRNLSNYVKLASLSNPATAIIFYYAFCSFNNRPIQESELALISSISPLFINLALLKQIFPGSNNQNTMVWNDESIALILQTYKPEINQRLTFDDNTSNNGALSVVDSEKKY